MAMKFLSLVFLLSTVVAGQAPRDKPPVDGSLIDGGAEVKLEHVLIIRHGNEEGLEDGPHLRIFITSGVIPLSVAGAATTLDALAYAKQSKIYGVVILADPSGKTTNATARILNTPRWVVPAPPGFAAKTPDPNVLHDLHITESRATGVVHVDLTRGWATASFDAPITSDPVTQDWTGDAAIQSAPAQAFLAYQEAASKGDMIGVGKHATAANALMMSELHREMGDEAFIRFANSDVNMKALPNSIVRVIVRGDTASVVFKVKEVASLVFEDNSWKLSD